MKTKRLSIMSLTVLIAAVLFARSACAQVSKEVLDSISTPNEVKTSIGTLKFLDGAPLPETAEKVYDYLDTARSRRVFEGDSRRFSEDALNPLFMTTQ